MADVTDAEKYKAWEEAFEEELKKYPKNIQEVIRQNKSKYWEAFNLWDSFYKLTWMRVEK